MRLLRETVWRDLRAGDVFRIPGVRGRRFRFVAFVTNFENGDRYIEAHDAADGRYRAFPPGARVLPEGRKARPRRSRRRRPPKVAPTALTLFDRPA